MIEGGGWSSWDKKGEEKTVVTESEGDVVMATTTPQEDATLSEQEVVTATAPNEVQSPIQHECKDTNSTQQAQQKRTRALQITTLYLLMAIHYSTPTGLMSESTVNLCGCVASWMGLAEAWRRVGG